MEHRNMEQRRVWTRPSLVRLSTTGSAEAGTNPNYFEGSKIKKVGGGFAYGNFTAS